MLDWGGRSIGGFEVTKQNLYEDGLRLPSDTAVPGRQARSLDLQPDPRQHPLRRHRAARHPDDRHLTRARRAAAPRDRGKYGYDAYVGGIRYACDASAETMRSALAALPDGVYEGEEWLDSDGMRADGGSVVRVRVVKRGGRAEFDMSGSSPANSSAINCPWPTAKTAVAIALKYLIDPKSPFTSGALATSTWCSRRTA